MKRLADEVLSRMSLSEKVGYVILGKLPNVENTTRAVPRLCLPAMTLTDGPNGLGDALHGVTQLPAAIGVAASFEPSLAFAIGRVEGLEARSKGFDAVQGPELNLARVPTSGRIFEAYGEDPFLASAMGVADVRGIQSTGTMAEAKHFTAYTQETARARIDQMVSPRVLAELYDAPFRAAITRAHVASLMCSFGSLNGINTCSNPALYAELHSWGFHGFVRSDARAATDIARAFRAGLAVIKPASRLGMEALVRRGAIPVNVLNAAVRSTLEEMFAFDLVSRPRQPAIDAPATSASHLLTALRAAEASSVLLKNNGALPLSRPGSIAVIGTDAASASVVAGRGSAYVHANSLSRPLSALRRVFAHSRIRFSAGDVSNVELDRLNAISVLHGTTLTLLGSSGPIRQDVAMERSPNVSPNVDTASVPSRGRGWKTWSMRVRARRGGVFEIAVQGVGDTWLSLDGHLILADRGLHVPANATCATTLKAGHLYTLSVTWFQVRGHRAPRLGIVDATPRIKEAAALAHRSRVAIVFAGQQTSEGFDRTSLNLGGDTNYLISAVAHANPRTIVVLNTGGAVLMPWLSHVAAVLEAWYPGQVDGRAVADVLSGRVDPSGRLPLSFPASNSQVPESTAAMFPGHDATVRFGSLSDLGYRWYQTHRVRPLFAFGFGLNYTTFQLGRPRLLRSAEVAVEVPVTNTGRRSGATVVELYVHYPSGLGEPPEQLRGFRRVSLRAGQRVRVVVRMAKSAFTIWRSGRFVTVPGRYRIDIGQSSSHLPYHISITRP